MVNEDPVTIEYITRYVGRYYIMLSPTSFVTHTRHHSLLFQLIWNRNILKPMADVHLVLVQWLLDLILILIDHIYMQQILLELISNGKPMQLDTIQRLLKNIFRKIIPTTYQVKILVANDIVDISQQNWLQYFWGGVFSVKYRNQRAKSLKFWLR